MLGDGWGGEGGSSDNFTTCHDPDLLQNKGIQIFQLLPKLTKLSHGKWEGRGVGVRFFNTGRPVYSSF